VAKSSRGSVCTAVVSKRNSKIHLAQPITINGGTGLSLQRNWTNGTKRRVEAKGHLYMEGDAKTHVYMIASGAICLYKLLGDGRRQVIDFAYEGDIVGLDSAQVEVCSAQATVATQVKSLPFVVLLKAAKQDDQTALKLYESVSRELNATREHLACVGQRGATERLATFLVVHSRKNGVRGQDPGTIKLLIKRADIADFMGVTIETVSRTFTELRRQGVIEIDQHTTIRLMNIKKLQKLAEGDARV
jgi:CRP/FNR family transcriptional regulator